MSERGIKLSQRQSEIYQNILTSPEQRGKYATIAYLTKTLPKSKTETLQKNLTEKVSELKRQGLELPKKQQKEVERLTTAPTTRGLNKKIEVLEKKLTPRKAKKKDSKQREIKRVQSERDKIVAAGFKLTSEQTDQLNEMVLKPSKFTLKQIQQLKNNLKGVAGGRTFTPKETKDYLKIYSKLSKKEQSKAGIKNEFNRRRLRDDKGLSNRAFITELKIKSSPKYKTMRKKQFVYNLLTAIEQQGEGLQQDLFKRVKDIYDTQGLDGVVDYFENMQKTNETIFATMFAYDDGITLDIREYYVRKELDLPETKEKSKKLTMNKLMKDMDVSDQQEQRRKYIDEAVKNGLNPSKI